MTGQQPGPGWRQGTDRQWYPPQPQQREPIPSRHPREPRKKRRKDRSWWPIIAAAIIGAIATIFAGLIANGAGALHISVAPAPTPTVTITPSSAPTATVTVSSSASAKANPANCLPGQNCMVQNLHVPLRPPGGFAAINFAGGQVLINIAGQDMRFFTAPDGVPELTGDFARAYSTDITAQNASRQQCQNAVNSAPDADPITNFHTGLLFCVGTTYGVALVKQTKPLGSSNILYLQETYWPNSG
jgi:hypothetical protein